MQFTTRRSMRVARAVLTAILATFLLPSMAWAEKTLRYSDHEPLGGMRTKFFKEVLFAAIERESNGRLKIDDHWNAELSNGYDALRIVGNGSVADMAVVVPEYAPNELPLLQLFKSFPMGPSGERQISFFRRVFEEIPEFSAELRKNNVVEIFLGTGYPVAFFSTTPLPTLEAIRGTRWRSASFWHQDFLANAGAIPVSMPWGDGIYKALAAKTLDGLMVNVDSGYTLNVHKTAPNVLISKDLWLGHLYILAMNLDTWNGLAQEDKDAIGRAAEIAYRALGPVMDSSFDAMLDDIRKDGAEVRLLERGELEAWKTATRYQAVQSAWIKEQEGKGVKNAGTVLKKIDTVMNDFVK